MKSAPSEGRIGDRMERNARDEDIERLKRSPDDIERSRSVPNGGTGALAVGVTHNGALASEGEERAYRSLVEHMSEGAAILSPEGRVLFSNSSLANALGIPLSELTGKNILDLVAQDMRPRLRDCLAEASGTSFDLELLFQGGNGSKVPMQVSLSGLDDPGHDIVCMTATELRTPENIAEVERRPELPQSLIEVVLMQMPAGLAVLDREGRLVLINGEMRKILNELRPPVVDDTAAEKEGLALPREQLGAVLNRMMDSTALPNIEGRTELEFDRPNGTKGHLSIRSAPVRDVTGEVDAGVSLILDVSETTEMQRERKELMDRLRRSNEELQQFVCVASHDLKEPLRMVSGYLGLIKRRYQGKLDADADEFMAYALDGAKRMEFLIDDLLRYTRVDTRNEPFRQVDLTEVMEGVLRDLDGPIKAAGATVVYGGLSVVFCDRSQMNQLLQNLISNAIKFRGTAPPLVEISETDEGKFHLFAVEDNGVGVPKGCSQRIFQMFQRAHKGQGYEGTGIGLAICKKIVERHGGRIWVESDGEHGSTFFFTLPIDTSRPVTK